MEKSGTGFPDCFHLNALMGDDVGRSLLAATYKGFFLLSGRTACRWKYGSCDFLFRYPALLCLSDPPQVLNNPQLGISFFFYLEKKKRTAPTNYLSGLKAP